jgi:hypothetical protein
MIISRLSRLIISKLKVNGFNRVTRCLAKIRLDGSRVRLKTDNCLKFIAGKVAEWVRMVG